MTSSLPFLKLHSWSMDDPKHPKVVFNVRINLFHSEITIASPVVPLPSSRQLDDLIRVDAVYYPSQ